MANAPSALQMNYMYPPNSGGQFNQQQPKSESDVFFHPETPQTMTKPPQQQVPPQTKMNQMLAPEPSFDYNTYSTTISFADLMKRIAKYIIEGLAVAFIAYLIGKDSLTMKQILIIAVTAALVFAILDTVSPTIAYGARFGAGFSAGAGLMGMGTPGIGVLSTAGVPVSLV